MRSSKHFWGFPWIMGRRRAKIRMANKLIQRALLACAAAVDSDSFCLLEFPEDLGKRDAHTPAFLWQVEALRKLAKRQERKDLLSIRNGSARRI